MKLFIGCSLILCFQPTFVALAQPTNYGQFAPPDAFENDSPLAYYGSENTWEPRQFSAEQAENHYKRRGQRHIWLIMQGNAQEAANSSRRYVESEPGDIESLFTLAVAQCQLGEIDASFETMKQAVQAGMPIERFLAGPRDLLAPLTRTQQFREYIAPHAISLLHGPMLGAVTDSQARFWFRTLHESNVEVRVYESENADTPVRVAMATSSEQNDFTCIISVDDLNPDTGYFYEYIIDGTRQDATSRASFSTFPKSGLPARFRIAFGGCSGYAPENERMWDTILSYNPAALLLLGDNVYIDLPEEAGPLHRYTYYQRQSRPEFRRLVRSIPVYATWDDHDAAVDDVWLGPYRDKPRWKPSMLQLQKENWNNPFYGDHEWPACWFNFAIGDVDFFVLDCRYYRTNPFGETQTMLGPTQKKWLLQELQESKATFKVLASSVAWASGAKPGSRDTWDGFPEEREEIFSFIEENSIGGIVLLSSDRHRSDAWKIPRPKGYPLYDLMSARLTNVETHYLMPDALFGYNEKCSFGLLTFDTKSPDDAKVTYDIVSIDGETVHSLTLTSAELSNKPKSEAR